MTGHPTTRRGRRDRSRRPVNRRDAREVGTVGLPGVELRTVVVGGAEADPSTRDAARSDDGSDAEVDRKAVRTLL